MSAKQAIKRSDLTDAERDLTGLPNVGPAIARLLSQLGIEGPDDLIGSDPDEMYDRLCKQLGKRLDPCVRDVFQAVIHFSEGGPPRPWWEFTPDRKARDAK